VSGDVEENTFVGGIPAKLIRKITPKDMKPKEDIEIIKYKE